MRAALSRERQGEVVFGVDMANRGLLCRAETSCRAVFAVLGSETTKSASVLRDAHELTVHGYHHVVLENPTWSYAAHTRVRGRKRK